MIVFYQIGKVSLDKSNVSRQLLRQVLLLGIENGWINGSLFRGRFVRCTPKVSHGLKIERMMN